MDWCRVRMNASVVNDMAEAVHSFGVKITFLFLQEELRLAQAALGEITGVTTADDLLGEIFGRFCIGK